MTLGRTRLTKLGMLVPLGEGSHERGSQREGSRVGRQLKEVGLHHSGVTWKCQDKEGGVTAPNKRLEWNKGCREWEPLVSCS